MKKFVFFMLIIIALFTTNVDAAEINDSTEIPEKTIDD